MEWYRRGAARRRRRAPAEPQSAAARPQPRASQAHRLSQSRPFVTDDDPVWVPAATSSCTCPGRTAQQTEGTSQCACAMGRRLGGGGTHRLTYGAASTHHLEHVWLVLARARGRARRQPVDVAAHIVLDDHEARAQLLCARGRCNSCGWPAGGGTAGRWPPCPAPCTRSAARPAPRAHPRWAGWNDRRPAAPASAACRRATAPCPPAPCPAQTQT